MNGFDWTPEAEAEFSQDIRGKDPWAWYWPGDNEGPRRNAPREVPFKEWDPFLRVWRQGPNLLRNFKPNRYFTRPHDGKRPGWLGRVKDAFTDEGADVFLTTSGDKRTLMRDRPQRWQWSGWPLKPEEIMDRMLYDKDFRAQDGMPIIDHKFSEKRGYEPHYNFRNREFESTRRVWSHPDKVWTDVQWPEGPRHKSRYPYSCKDLNYMWRTRVSPWAGAWPGGRPR